MYAIDKYYELQINMTSRRYKSVSSRQQTSLLPPSIEGYVHETNPVRAIDAYVDTLDLAKQGFQNSPGGVCAGQPAYPPEALLKLHLYGYLNKVRSSRRLESETYRNLEAVWLVGALHPRYKTIADFRKDNSKALTATNRDFVLLCKELQLFGGETLGIDGSFFKAKDSGYYEGNQTKHCEDQHIIAYVAVPDRSNVKTQGRYTRDQFSFNADHGTYTCPQGKPPVRYGTPHQINNKAYARYKSKVSACKQCPVHGQCLTGQATAKQLMRREHEDVVERHQARMHNSKGMMRRRGALALHPFGTLKRRAGWDHFLMRGLNKSQGEFSLMVLGYNFTRALNILGMGTLRDHCVQRSETKTVILGYA
jgi:transposase